MRRWMYDWMYRVWAPWDAVGVRDDLRELLDSGRVTPHSHPRAVDLGCGTGANAVYLAEHGFEVVGVDFSPVALAKAEARAAEAGVECQLRAGRPDRRPLGTGRTVRPRPGLRHPGRPRPPRVAGRWPTTCGG